MSIHNFIHDLQVDKSWSHRNLTVYPLVGANASKLGYLTLDEAIATDRFRIGEVSAIGSVPELKALNGLDQPVLLLDGEELVGAKQNRVLNLTIMVPAHAEITIPVSCVEAGRWQQQSDRFMAADRTQFARGRAKKLAQVSSSLRHSGGRSSDQTDIWNEIAAKSERMAVASPTAAMSALYDHSRARLDDFVGAMPHNERQVGAMFCIGGDIVGIDAFDCATTFAKAAPKLIRSYAIDAMESPIPVVSKDLGVEAVRSFLVSITAAEATRFKALGLGDDVPLKGPHLAGAALEISGQVVHLVSFPSRVYAGDQEGQARTAGMARASRRRTFH